VEESLASEHSSELLGHTLEHLLNGSGVTQEGSGHLEALGRNIANRGLDVVGNPFDEVRGVLVLDVKHLLIDLLGGHAATEEARGSEVTTVTRISGAHHVLSIELLLSELRDGKSTVLLRASGSQGSETSHEEVETGERNQVGSKLAEIRVQLTRESEAAGHAGHGSRDKVVKITISGSRQLKSAEADIVQGFVIEDDDFIGILDKLVDRESGVVGLNDGIGYLGGGYNGEGKHHTIGVLFTDLGN